MKRLIRAYKSSSKDLVVKFVETWFHAHSTIRYDYDILQEIAEENPDCIFSGIAYRTMELEAPYEEIFDENELLEYVKKLIYPSESVTSFSASRKGVEYYTQTEFPSFGAIISSNVNGIYLPQLVQKHQKAISLSREIDARILDSIVHEDEVVVFNGIPNFDIVGLIVDYEIKWLK